MRSLSLGFHLNFLCHCFKDQHAFLSDPLLPILLLTHVYWTWINSWYNCLDSLNASHSDFLYNSQLACMLSSFSIYFFIFFSIQAPFFSLNLHTLAEQLAKVDLSQRLFIEEDLLPPELVCLHPTLKFLITLPTVFIGIVGRCLKGPRGEGLAVIFEGWWGLHGVYTLGVVAPHMLTYFTICSYWEKVLSLSLSLAIFNVNLSFIIL